MVEPFGCSGDRRFVATFGFGDDTKTFTINLLIKIYKSVSGLWGSVSLRRTRAHSAVGFSEAG